MPILFSIKKKKKKKREQNRKNLNFKQRNVITRKIPFFVSPLLLYKILKVTHNSQRNCVPPFKIAQNASISPFPTPKSYKKPFYSISYAEKTDYFLSKPASRSGRVDENNRSLFNHHQLFKYHKTPRLYNEPTVLG